MITWLSANIGTIFVVLVLAAVVVYYDDRIMMTQRRAAKLPEKEDTVFNYPGDNLFFGDVEGSREKRTKEDLHEEWVKCLTPYWKK